MSLKEIEKITTMVEDFIECCLSKGYLYVEIFEYINEEHKG